MNTKNKNLKTICLRVDKNTFLITSLFSLNNCYTLITKKKDLKKINKEVIVSQTASTFKFNNTTLFYNYDLNAFLSKKYFGTNLFFIKQLEQRIEISRFYSFKFYKIDKWSILYNFLLNVIPKNKSVKEKLILNLNLLFLIRSYRGWRHSFSLPSRGQRTWSNAWSSFKSKNVLREYKFNAFKTGLGSARPEEIKYAFFLEQLNILWKWQWIKEWHTAFKRRKSQIKKSRGIQKLDLNVLARSNPNFLKSKKQTVIPIGFEADFTKKYLKEVKLPKKKKHIC